MQTSPTEREAVSDEWHEWLCSPFIGKTWRFFCIILIKKTPILQTPSANQRNNPKIQPQTPKRQFWICSKTHVHPKFAVLFWDKVTKCALSVSQPALWGAIPHLLGQAWLSEPQVTRGTQLHGRWNSGLRQVWEAHVQHVHLPCFSSQLASCWHSELRGCFQAVMPVLLLVQGQGQGPLCHWTEVTQRYGHLGAVWSLEED